MRLINKAAILVFFLIPLVSCMAASFQDVKTSDHYNGKLFFNPTLEKQFSPSFSDIVDMIKQGRAAWPNSIENTVIPEVPENIGSDEIAITFINHATFLIQFRGLNILTDPIWSTRASPFSWAGPKRIRSPGVQINELPHIDVIVISHNHYDHLDITTLKELNNRFSPTVLVPIGDKGLIESAGIMEVYELDWWESIEIAETEFTFTPAQHSSSRYLFDKDRSLWGSFFISRDGRSVYFGGDTGYSTHYIEIKNRLSSPDVALLGIGSYAPRFFMKPIHMNPAEAVQAHKDMGATISIGMHFGTFQLSSERIEEPLEDLKTALIQEEIQKDKFIVIQEGETLIYGGKH
ncbi:MAG: MBL fold metallo-hydrolase [Pseudomonadales bacterium]|nr:MBL fold metallo-hydrolase [Pseudomonadales bacterium]